MRSSVAELRRVGRPGDTRPAMARPSRWCRTVNGGPGGAPVPAGSPVPRPGDPSAESGMVTAELAFASLGAALACVLMAWVLTIVALLVRCQDTAAEVARQAARADHTAVAAAEAGRPTGSTVTIRQDARQVTVRVELAARPWADWLPSVPVAVAATVLREPA